MRQRLLAAGAALLLAAAVAAVYHPVRTYPFINYDDDVFVSRNAAVAEGLTLRGVRYAFTDGHLGVWIPLTWLSFMAEADAHGLRPGVMHLTNVALHGANALLLFLLLLRLTGRTWPSAAVASLFALHPLQVESVAWVTERKDVLSTCFLLLSLLAYLGFCRRRRLSRYLLAAACLALSLSAKAMYVTAPALLLLLDFWPLGRHRAERRGALVLEKVPFLLLGAGAALLNARAHLGFGGFAPLGTLSPGERLAHAVVSYAVYLRRIFRPARLAVLYPHPWEGPPLWAVAGSVALLGLVGLAAARGRKRRPFLLFGWLWFLVALLPVIGLTQSGAQLTADRYTYVPMVGVLAMIVWSLAEARRRIRGGALLVAGAAMLVILGCGIAARRQVGYWRDGKTLFGRALEVTTDNYVAHNVLAYELLMEGRAAEALHHAGRAFSINTDDPTVRLNLGVALALNGRPAEAVSHFEWVLRRDPGNWRARKSLEQALRQIAARN